MIIDLAGSERLSKSGVTGDAAQEAIEIKTSSSTIFQCDPATSCNYGMQLQVRVNVRSVFRGLRPHRRLRFRSYFGSGEFRRALE